MEEILPLVSVIVPCYNEVDCIEKCLTSILNQDFTIGKFEIIVVDGLSTDGTRDIIKCLADEHPNIKLVDNKKRITPAAFNLGIKHACGKYISIMGAHSEYDPHYLSNSIKLFDEHPEISCSGGPIISVGKSNFGIAAAIAMSHPVGIGNAKHRFPEYEGYAEGACFPTFKREVFNQIGLYDEKFVKNQDDELNYRLINRGGKIFISPKVKSFYYVRESPRLLFNQYFNYGFWRVRTIKKHKKVFSLRQIVPSTFLSLMLMMFLSGAVISAPLKFLMFILPLLYTIIILFFSIRIGAKNNYKVGINFFLAVLILHFSYGSGFIVSLFTKNKSVVK